MLTPQEVSERSFAKASFGGYNMSMVDDFLDVLTADYTALYNENAVLKSKMKVLVDKVEEYRSTEEAMRKALLTAQRFADEMVAEAKSKKEELLKEAEAESARRMQELKQQQADEEAKLAAARKATAEFAAAVKKELAKEADFLSRLDEMSAPEKKEAAVQSTVIDIEQTMQQIMEKEIRAAKSAPAAPAEDEKDMEDTVDFSELFRKDDGKAEAPAPQPVEEEEKEPEKPAGRSRIDFSNLQFGDDYEME